MNHIVRKYPSVSLQVSETFEKNMKNHQHLFYYLRQNKKKTNTFLLFTNKPHQEEYSFTRYNNCIFFKDTQDLASCQTVWVILHNNIHKQVIQQHPQLLYIQT